MVEDKFLYLIIMSFAEMDAQATEMTLARLQKEQEERNKLEQIKKENLEKAKAAGFSTVEEFIKTQKANQIHLQPLPESEIISSGINHGDYALHNYRRMHKWKTK